MKLQDRKELTMRGKQLTLLDDQSFKELGQNQYMIIQVKPLNDDAVEDKKLQAFVCLKSDEMNVKGIIFDDCLGNHYVGCRLLKKETYNEKSNQIPVFKLPNNIQDYLINQLTPIISLLDQKRRNYYAN